MRDFMIKRAAQEALKSTVIRGKLGAVVFDKKTVLGAGFNHFCARTRYPVAIQHRRYPFSIHAEMAALLDAGPAARGADLLVVRMRHDGTKGMALPCPWCWGYLVFCGVNRCWYSNRAGDLVSVEVTAQHPLHLVRGQRQISG